MAKRKSSTDDVYFYLESTFTGLPTQVLTAEYAAAVKELLRHLPALVKLEARAEYAPDDEALQKKVIKVRTAYAKARVWSNLCEFECTRRSKQPPAPTEESDT